MYGSLLDNFLAPAPPTTSADFRFECIVTCLSLKSAFSSLAHTIVSTCYAITIKLFTCLEKYLAIYAFTVSNLRQIQASFYLYLFHMCSAL